MKYLIWLLPFTATVALSPGSMGAEKHRTVLERLQQVEEALQKIDSTDDGVSIKGERLLLGQWIADCREALKKGNITRGKRLVAQAEAQLDLVEIIRKISELLTKAMETEKKISETERAISLVKSQINRLTLETEGSRMTGAFPRSTDE